MFVGHDDEVLIDPILQGASIPVEAGFLTGSSRFLLRVTDESERTRADLLFEAAGTAYGSDVAEDDVDLRITNALRAALPGRFVLDGALVAWRYRRGDGSVYDLDLIRPELRLAWTPGPKWLLTTGAKFSWLTFPFREAGEDTILPGRQGEDQQQLDLLVGAIRTVGRGYAGMEALLRGTRSSFPEAEYAGPVVTARAGALLARRWDVSTFLVYGHRSYDAPLVDAEDAPPEERQDDTYQIGLTVEWLLRPRARLLADLALVRQNSTIEDYRYDQARVSIGVSVDLLDTLPRRTFGVEAPARRLSPTRAEGGIRFLCRAPGAREVSLVGGFNGWDPARGRMEGPDGEGIWSLTAPVPAGRWRYAFVVDGVWVAPEDAPQTEDDGFGGVQGILVVDPADTGL